MDRRGFTLIELLMVIGVLAILTTFVVLILNPAQLVAQGRDSRRVNDIRSISKAVDLAKVYGGAVDSTEANRVYVSLPDTNGDGLCDEYSLPSLASGWEYRCMASSSELRSVDGTGWIPINFTAIPAGKNPITILPLDPLNVASSGNYYAYSQGATSLEYVIASRLDSQKYLTELAAQDGGNDSDSYETRPAPWFTGGGGGGAAVLFAGTGNNMYRCLISTGCDTDSEWVAVFTPPKDAVMDFAIDSVNNVMYHVTSGDSIERCLLSTGCDEPADWALAFRDPLSIYFDSIVFDPITAALYAGGEGGRLYRCAVSTGCDGGAAEWPLVLDTPYGPILDIVALTSTPGYSNSEMALYANSIECLFSGCGAVIYRCLLSTGCDASGEWVISFNGTSTDDAIWELALDVANGVIYGSGFDVTGGELWRCDIKNTSCDAAGDWVRPYAIASTNFVSATIANSTLYVGEDRDGLSGLYINRCPLSNSCDEQADFSRYSIGGSDVYIYAIGYDYGSSVLYAGTGPSATIYRCPLSSSCDAGTDWALVADKPDIDDYFPEIFYLP